MVADMQYEKPCYATRLNNVVWKHAKYESALGHAIKLTQRHGAPKHDNWKNYYEGFISDWQLFRTEIENIYVHNYGNKYDSF